MDDAVQKWWAKECVAQRMDVRPHLTSPSGIDRGECACCHLVSVGCGSQESAKSRRPKRWESLSALRSNDHGKQLHWGTPCCFWAYLLPLASTSGSTSCTSSTDRTRRFAAQSSILSANIKIDIGSYLSGKQLCYFTRSKSYCHLWFNWFAWLEPSSDR